MSLNLDKLYSNNIWWRWNKTFQDTLAKHSQIIETSQGRIEYALHGQGPVVLGLHGTPGGYDQTLFTFKEVIDSGEFTLLTVSRPGYGRTLYPNIYNPTCLPEFFHQERHRHILIMRQL